LYVVEWLNIWTTEKRKNSISQQQFDIETERQKRSTEYMYERNEIVLSVTIETTENEMLEVISFTRNPKIEWSTIQPFLCGFHLN
jgi:hypothetical protein